MYMQSTLINMYIQCTFNNNVTHNVHCDFFNVSRMYVPMYMRSTCRYIKCSSQIDLMYIFSDVHEMYVKFLADITHTLSAFIKLPRKRRYLLQPIFWPIRRNHLLTQKPEHQTFPREKPLAQRAMHPNLHLVPLRPYHERISVKLTATRVDKKDITLEIALATPRENPFYPKTNHFDRY